MPTNVNKKQMDDGNNDLTSQLKDLRKLYKERRELDKQLADARYKNELDIVTELEEIRKQKEKEILEIREEREKTLIEKNKAAWDETVSNLGNAAVDAVNSLKKTLDTTMDNFLKNQESIAYNLNGSTETFKDVTNKLTSAIAGTGIVRQEAVYNKLNDLVKQGIIYNVEQRAFLQTLSDDLGMMFDATDGSLVRLINLQRKDLTDERMAIQASLKTFLNQNYETSQYIVESFKNVSASLLEAQSLMDSRSSIELEAVVQKWMGSLSSVGMSSNTVESIATAIGQLGAGNISALGGSNMQNLLVMGAARSGQSYARMLTEGLTAETAEALLSGIVSYIAQMGGNASNVVKSEYARIFGLNVSDIRAAMQVGDLTQMGQLSSDISTLLSQTSNYMYTTTQINKGLENFMYEWATGVAADTGRYTTYKILDVVSDIGAALTSGMTVKTPSFFGLAPQAEVKISEVISMVPLLATIGSLAETVSSAFSNFSGGTDAQSIFARLAGSGTRDQYIKATGALTGLGSLSSGMTTSGSMIIANTSTSDMANTALVNSAELNSETVKGEETEYTASNIYEELFSENRWGAVSFEEINTSLGTINDSTLAINDYLSDNWGTINNIYNFLSSDLPVLIKNDLPSILASQPYMTYTRISEASNTVTIGNDLSSQFDLMVISALNLTNIYSLLLTKLTGANNGNYNPITTAGSGQNWNTGLNWLTKPLENMYNSVEVAATGG